ncbi:cation:proton antiporter [Marinicella sp. S1101]|uniref:cation:proton antiporter domain-containing protein n=1 Tax=Marinicella marina TaxID=2996016 RepID=UPI002260CA7D|nr:cation:proton antiporter [Marinicella marina]MCX7554156.1 cation:proton antiporter [Marinicella marina]MDJ1141151.1 cation:proton antiporter [Marinicella marina]
MTEAFVIASLFLGLAVLLVPLANRLNLGSVLGYLIAGAFVGGALTWLAPMMGMDSDYLLEQLNHATEFGVVLMLFVIGLEIQPSHLWRMKGTILNAGGLQVSLTALLIMAVAMFGFGLDWRMGLAIGLTLALSSTAIIMSTLDEKGWQNTVGGKASFSALLFQDIAVIPIIAVIPLLAVSVPSATEHAAHGIDITSHLPTWLKPIVVVGAIVLVYVFSRYLINPLFDYIAKARQKEIFTTAALGLVTLIAALMSLIGLSPALGVFIAGVILSESEYRHELEADIEPFKGLLLGVFFMTVGAAFNFVLFAAQFWLIIGLTFGLIALKAAVLYVVGWTLKLKSIEHALFFLALAQGGEFAFVLLTLAVSNQVVDPSIADTLRIVVALSMAITPLLFLFYEKVLLARMNPKEEQQRAADDMDENNRVIIAGVGRFGQIVGRMMQYNQFSITALDNNPDMIDTLRKFGWKVFYGDATRMDLLHAAGIESASAMVVAMDDAEKVVKLSAYLLKHHPQLELFVRAKDRTVAYQLHHLGVKHVYRETFETSATLGEDVLKHLGMRAYQAKRSKLRYQQEDEALVKKLAASYMEEDEKGHVMKVQEQLANLAEVLDNDQHIKQYQLGNDSGWDESSLIADLGNKPKD